MTATVQLRGEVLPFLLHTAEKCLFFYFLNSQSIPVYFRSQEKMSTKRSRVFDDADDNGENGVSL